MENSIAKTVRSCMRAFQSLSAAVLEASGQQDHSLGEMNSEWAKDKFDRFKLWSQNIGAHRSGRSSLDYRLRDASNLKKQAIDLVRDLAQALEDGKSTSIISGIRIPWDLEEPSKEDLASDSVSLSSASEDDETSIEVDSELMQIMMDVVDIIDCLLRLSVSVQNPAPHDRFKAATITNTSFYEADDIKHVRAKFNSAEKWLAERLGKAISHRRQYFKYRDAHHQKLASGLEDPETETHIAQSTVASSIPQHLKTTNTRGDSASFGVLEEDQRSDTGYSQTSYATSTANSERLRVPKIPEAHRRGAFECPFCFMMISVSTDYAWKKHVFADLRPYVCLEQACEIPHEEYSRRHHWIGHLQQAHWRAWSCPFTCEGEMTSEDALKAHLVATHCQNLHSKDIEKLMRMGARKVLQFSEATCPLCREILPSAKKYTTHVGRHQEELALFALPKLDVPDEHGQEEEESTPGELDPEQDDSMAESESSDEDELAQETMEYPSRNDERESFDLPLMSFAAPPDSAAHEQLGLVSNVEDSVDDDQENVQDRKSDISAGRGEQMDQQRLELPKEAEEHPWDDGSISGNHNHHQRGRPRDESHISSNSHRHSSQSSPRWLFRRGSDGDLTVELNEVERKSTVADEEETHTRRVRDQLRKRSKKDSEEVKQQKDRLMARFERSETSNDTSKRSSSAAPRSSRRVSNVSYTDRPYVEPLGPAAARPTVAIPTSPSIVSPGRRFDGPIAISKTSQPAMSLYKDPAYSSTPRPAGMERPTVFYKYDGVMSPTAGYENGNYHPHPLNQAPDQPQRAQQPTSIDEPADNDHEKRHNAASNYQDPEDSSAPRRAGMERPTVSYKYDDVMSPTTGYENGNYYPHPL